MPIECNELRYREKEEKSHDSFKVLSTVRFYLPSDTLWEFDESWKMDVPSGPTQNFIYAHDPSLKGAGWKVEDDK